MNRKAQGNISRGKELPTSITAWGPLIMSIPTLSPLGGDNVPLLAIHVLDQRDIGTAVRIVFDRFYFTGNSDLISFKIDLPIEPLMSAALMPNAYSSLGSPAGLLGPAAHQGFFRLYRWLVRNNPN